MLAEPCLGLRLRVRTTHWDAAKIRFLTVVDEYTRECIALHVDYRLKSDDVMEVLTALFIRRGIPDHIRSDNGGEFTADAIRLWLGKQDRRYATLHFSRQPLGKRLQRKLQWQVQEGVSLIWKGSTTLKEAQVLAERMALISTITSPRTHLSGYKPPAPLAYPLPDHPPRPPRHAGGARSFRYAPARSPAPITPEKYLLRVDS